MQKSEKKIWRIHAYLLNILVAYWKTITQYSMAYLVLTRKSASNRFTSEHMNWMRFSFRSVMKGEGWDLR